MRMFLLFTLLLSLSSCATVKVHKKTPMFIDIEVDLSDAWVGCSDTNLKEENSMMTLYAIHEDTTHEFMFRKVHDVDWCLKLEKEYSTLLSGVPLVRLVGISPRKGDDRLITSRVPDKFKNSKTKMTWTFIRVHTMKGCKSYFEEDCKPENYWGGIFPAK